MGLLSVLVLGVALITAAIAFLGSFAPNKQYLAVGFAGAILAVIVYAGAVSVTLSNLCRNSGSATCTSGPVGSAFSSGAAVSWGFQTGFYLCLVGAISLLFAIIFHQTFLRSPTAKTPSPRFPTPGVFNFFQGRGPPLKRGPKSCYTSLVPRL